MRTYAHWLRDERSLPAALLDQMLAPRGDEVGSPPAAGRGPYEL